MAQQSMVAEQSTTTVYPNHLMLELTDKCNLKCIICVREEYEAGIGGPGVLMSLDDVLKLEAPIRHAKILTVTGFGETFLHPQLKQILDAIYDLNPSNNLIKIVTNGTALGADKTDWFAGHLHTLSISLNASNAESYAKEMHPYEVAAGKDMSSRFDRLLTKITTFADRLSPADRRKVHLHYVVHRENMKNMPDFVRLCHSMGLSEVQFTHFKVHREKNIKDSIFWAKDDYNDLFDEASQLGRELGITVGGRKFFTEGHREFIGERDCTWPEDTSIVSVKGNVVPCCYWAGGGDTGNAFTSNTGFNEIWFGEFYNGLRRKRDAKPCHTCNILTTFDYVDTHFSPYLKQHEHFKSELAELRELSARDIGVIATNFDRVSLDMSYHRSVIRKLSEKVARLSEVDVDSPAPFASIAPDILKWAAETNADLPRTIDLSGTFVGLGWGGSEKNNNSQSWRWTGGSRGPSLVFIRLDNQDYVVRFTLHTATQRGIETLRLGINGQDSPNQGLNWHEDGTASIWMVIDAGTIAAANGIVEIAINHDHGDDSRVAFSRLETAPLVG